MTSSLARGELAGASSDLLLLHICVKLNSSSSGGDNAPSIVLDKIK